ncbi:orotidine-5'-phosphate decarboxylase [Glacieibacterium frigidum]|uniref:Orotidine 5'-phosphate decarboxylase n=1 Tax=Glacieibacterium frigidum TaxID=2593303 RepID=A0A552UF50_9SPHN|nr:orotidine-5'-phosphate decarboxylase [Glacieibacterium frigidum]TRW16857.1 orotidine-5'-phosphate decarboxylase [Glacieibacterium frigidum]
MNPVFVALDTSDLGDAEHLARAVGGHVGGLKLGLQFFMANGPEGVRRMGGLGLPIFLDVKLHDIPNTVAGALKSLGSLDLAVVNVHAGGGADMLKAARDACAPATKLIAVTVLTSLDDDDLLPLGVSDGAAAQVARFADLSREAGLDGVVCSPHEVAALKAGWTDGYFVVPGIRVVDGGDDQKRTLTPRAALDAGASMLVIGRPITGAADPAEAARAIAASL